MKRTPTLESLCMNKWYAHVLSQSKAFVTVQPMSNDASVDALAANGPSIFGRTVVNTSQWCYRWRKSNWLCGRWISRGVPPTPVVSSSIGASMTLSPSLSSDVEGVPSDLDGTSRRIYETVTIYTRNNG